MLFSFEFDFQETGNILQEIWYLEYPSSSQ